jgi:hypothetical protein
MFRYGLAVEPLENERQRLTTAIEANQPADNSLVIKAGAEWLFMGTFALRTGYNFNADAMKLSAGAGFLGELGGSRGSLDYAYTDGGFLGSVHRLSLGVRF